MINLSLESDRKQLSNQIKSDIDRFCADKYNEGHRAHLGASVMGEACSRKLWYGFRWCKLEKHEGRVQRLFQVGHEAEPRFKMYLEGIGFIVKLFDETKGRIEQGEIINDEQFRISAHNGHYGGSLDGMAFHQEYGQFLLEFKTNGTGSGYNDVGTKGLAKAKPKHFGQMAQYGWHYKLKYGLYLIENKNDSDITVQIVELDWKLGQELQNKAGDIINARTPPAKISLNEAYFDCKYCTFVDICHNGECVETNCRSCRYSKPVEDARWWCEKHSGLIPESFIATGCSDHVSCNGE
jgi:hypothetical protein